MTVVLSFEYKYTKLFWIYQIYFVVSKLFRIFVLNKANYMKEKILKLKEEGKSYREIHNILGCSIGTISYHCGDGQKEKSKIRANKNRTNIRIKGRIIKFKNRGPYFKALDFQRKSGNNYTFNVNDVIKKFGENTECYLSGEKINLEENTTYELDHIIPVCKGGDSSLENLGILYKQVNQMKGGLTNEELINWCKKILQHNGYKVEDSSIELEIRLCKSRVLAIYTNPPMFR